MMDDGLPDLVANNTAKMLDPFNKWVDAVAASTKELKAQVTAMQMRAITMC